jgi:endonuclease-3
MKRSRVSPRFFSVGELQTRLEGEYGKKIPPKRRPGVLEVLVRTILSQNTSDLNSGRAYRNLRKDFPAWEDVAGAPVKKLARSIRSGGLSGQKARHIKELMNQVGSEDKGYSLQHLCKKQTEEAREYLLGFKGVGEKTAACVILFACGKPAFPVDTHISRVARRLGWLDSSATYEKAHHLFEKIVPGEDMYQMHLNIIEHGRKVCHSQKPACHLCCLKDKCLYFSQEPGGS